MAFKTTPLFESLQESLAKLSEDEKKAQIKKVNAVFQFDVKGSGGEIKSWVITLKGDVASVDNEKGVKPDVTLTLTDQDLLDLATGKLNGQKAFTSGKLKVKGNIMQVTKVEGILKSAMKKAKL